MTDHDEQQTNNNLDDHASEADVNADTSSEEHPTDDTNVSVDAPTSSAEAHDDLDVEGALAAIADLHSLTSDEETEAEIEPEADADIALQETEADDGDIAIQEFERIEREPVPDEADTEGEIADERTYANTFPRPPLSVLHRGQMASVIPALFLIGVGGYLTFVVTTIGASLEPVTIAGVLIGGLGAMLIAQWLSSARWATGSLFIGVLMLLVGGAGVYLLLPNNLNLNNGYPLLLTAVGTAFVVTDIASPSGRRLWLMGLILALSGLGGIAALMILQDSILALSNPALLILAVVIIAVFAIAPFIYHRQQ